MQLNAQLNNNFLQGIKFGLYSLLVFLIFILFIPLLASLLDIHPPIEKVKFELVYFYCLPILPIFLSLSQKKPLYNKLINFSLLGTLTVLEIFAIILEYLMSNVYVILHISMAAIITAILAFALISFILNRTSVRQKIYSGFSRFAWLCQKLHCLLNRFSWYYKIWN